MRSALSAACALATWLAAAPLALAAAPNWVVDKAASRITFRSTFAGDTFDGTFKRWDAQIQFDPKALAASRAVVTVETGSASTGNLERDEAIPSGDWFNVAKFPKATFVTTGFKDLGGGRYQAAGNLTVKGVTKPLVLPFTLTITGDEAKMSSAISVNRSAFGVGQGQFASADTVPLDVALNISLTAKRGK